MKALRRVRTRHNRAALLLMVLVGLALLGNGAFVVAYRQQSNRPFLLPQEVSSTELILATPLNGSSILAATEANTLLLVEHGRLTHRAQFGSLIGGLAAAADGGTVYAGTADGTVTVLDRHLTKQRSFQVSGRVVGLVVPPGGGLVVAHGQGAYSDRYYVSYYPPAARQPAFTRQVGFTITALGALRGQAIYGLLNSQVGAIRIGQGGQIAWQVLLSNPPRAVLARPEAHQILIGDDKGALALLDDRGGMHGVIQLSQYPLHALAFDHLTGDYVAGDANGTLYVLNRDRRLLLTRTVAGSGIEALLPMDRGHLLVVPSNGRWLDLATAEIGSVGQQTQIVRAWLGFDAAMLVAILVTLVVAVRRLRALARTTWHARQAYAFIVPALGLIGVFTYYPAAMAVYYSFTDFSLRNVTHFVGLQNYSQILTGDFYFRTGLVNMVILTVASVLKTVTVPLLVAELIFWLRNRVHQYLFRTLFVLPAVVPGLVFTLLWRQVYDPRTGLLNQLLAAIGLSQWQHAWLGDASTALWAIVGVGFPYVDAFAFLILLGGLLNINAEFFDAAKVDGAGRWARLVHIDLPLLVAQFRILLFFAVTGTVQGFASIFILTQGGPGYATYVPALQMYLRIADGDFGYASAIGVVLFVMILVATLFILRFRRQEAVEMA